jgi:hypothetical protein
MGKVTKRRDNYRSRHIAGSVKTNDEGIVAIEIFKPEDAFQLHSSQKYTRSEFIHSVA